MDRRRIPRPGARASRRHPQTDTDDATSAPSRATEELSYGAPSFKISGIAVAGYAYHKNHCSYLLHSGTVLESMADDLAPYERTKGSLRFPVDEALPDALVARLVETRLAELGLGQD